MHNLNHRISFSDEQAMLLDSATSFCRAKSSIQAVRGALLTDQGFDAAVWREMVTLGWAGIAIPEAHGGSGLTLAEAATICEPMGRHLLSTPFASTQCLIQGLLAGASSEQQAAWLPALSQGAIGTVALLESDGNWQLDDIETRAVLHGDVLQLSGAKTLVCDAAAAEMMLVSVALDGALALVLVRAADLQRQRIQREVVIDETQRSYCIDLTGVSVSANTLIRGEAARRALAAVRQGALLLATAEAAGGIAGVLDVVVDYLNLRTTFGRKIGAYQSLKHPAAEILIGLERSRSHLYHAATLMAAGEDAEIALRMAKAEAGDAFVFAGDRAVQFHGGFGFTYECDAQLYLRRALWLQSSYGDAAHHRRRLADLLLPVSATQH